MLKKIVQKTAILSVKKIMQNSMDNHLKIKLIDEEVVRNFNKEKSYLLYIHVPFCHTFCPYCSFHKYKYDEETATQYFKSLRIEMRKVKEEGFKFNSLYVGGGTTLINEKELIKTLELAKELFNIEDISCESDPNHIEANSLKNFQGLIKRISVGVQSFDDNILQKVSRSTKFGSSKVVQEKILAMNGILPITNIDLIFNFPTETDEILLNDLECAKNLGVNQITTYPLMSTDMTSNAITKAFNSKNNSKEYHFYNLIKESLKDYHNNNSWSFSKEETSLNDEYVTQHNEYIGIGSGAFSFINDSLYINAFDLAQYAELVDKRPHAIIATSTFELKERIQYQFLLWLFNGLVDIKKFDQTFNVSLRKILKQELYMLEKANAIQISNDNIYPTDFGKYLTLVMMKEFYSGMDKVRALFREKNVATVK
ncbi:coproporphyrinogen III oxidase family protein [Sulfurospirillum arcachonense]|uniref:coproporphyrinogen III oxidase family protein n=1 Tax=Sulfurospirillum arcachonense TaxID=57666 RepID=UPI00046AE65F|nr:coproporphyrinogen III oxidase family protein [Sulfurospirillum arcachonense]